MDNGVWISDQLLGTTVDKQAQGTEGCLFPHGDRRKEPVLDLAVPIDQQPEEAYDDNDDRWMGKTAPSVRATQIADRF